jgi:hypothetical protein
MAIMYAASQGLAQPGISHNVQTYPVGADGKEIADLAGEVKRFRAEIPVTRRLV